MVLILSQIFHLLLVTTQVLPRLNISITTTLLILLQFSSFILSDYLTMLVLQFTTTSTQNNGFDELLFLKDQCDYVTPCDI